MKNTILSLNKGDRIVFDGKITSQGGHFINHKIELTNLSHTQRPQETRDTTTHLTQQTNPTSIQYLLWSWLLHQLLTSSFPKKLHYK